LELSNYFQKSIFNQQTAAPQKVPPGAPRAPPLLRHWSYTWYISSIERMCSILNNMRSDNRSRMRKL